MNSIKTSLTAAAVICAFLLGSASASVLGNPVDGYEDVYLGTSMALSKGVYWTGSEHQTENYIEYTPSADIYPVVVSGSKLCNYGNFSSMAALLGKEGKHVIGGINGDYYVTSTYEPLGLVVQDGELWSSDAGHFAVGFKNNGRAVFGQPELRSSVELSGKIFAVDGINKTRLSGRAVVYSDAYQMRTKNTGGGTDIICSADALIRMNCSIPLTVDEILTAGGAVEIPEGKFVISVSDNASQEMLDAIGEIQIADTIVLNVSSPPEWADVNYAVGSLYKLVSNGNVVSGFPGGIAPRTAVGVKADNTLVFYTSDGRQPGYSAGISIKELAERMLELGCVEATIMDGGGSTSMNAIYIGDSSVSQINRPSDGYQRSVSNYIMLVTEKQAIGTASRLAVYPLTMHILSGATAEFEIKAADANGYAATVPDKVSLSVPDGLGSVSPEGSFVASGSGKGSLTVSCPGLVSACVGVNVVETPDILRLYYQGTSEQAISLSVETGSVTELMAQAMDNYVYLRSQDKCYNWSVKGDIGSVDFEGTFTAASEPGKGSIELSAGGTAISVPVEVKKPGNFDDVGAGDWYYDAAQYVSDKKLMQGTASRTFSPDTNMTRAMAVVVLYRASGGPASSVKNSFSDVNNGDWYYDAVSWASEKGIVEGYDGKFAPNDSITREQLSAILWRYYGSPTHDYALGAYEDTTDVSEWALSAINWAVGTGAISGVTGTRISPKGMANRAQMAIILMRLTQRGSL